MKDLMIDLETVSTSPRAGIIQIAAVMFDINTGEMGPEMNHYVEMDSNHRIGRQFDQSTINWWTGPKNIKMFEEILAQPGIEAKDTIPLLAAFSKTHKPKRVWSNGASFDLPILRDLADQTGHKLPWLPWIERCVRTVKSFDKEAKSYLFEYANIAGGAQTHNALYDSKAQAYQMFKVNQKLSLY